jgi:hypothetical protein
MFGDGYNIWGERIVEAKKWGTVHVSRYVKLDRWHKWLRKMRGYWLCRNGHGETFRESAHIYRCRRCKRVIDE